jgi:hypothetical protein
MTVGPLLCAGGLLLFTRLSADARFMTEVLPAVLVFGSGMSATVAPLTDTVMSSVADEYSGIAAAFNNVVSRVAGLLAVAGLGVVVSLSFNRFVAVRTDDLSLDEEARTAVQEVAREPTGAFDVETLPPEARSAVTSSYTAAFDRAMVVSAGMAGLGGVVAWLTIRKGSPAQDEKVS